MKKIVIIVLILLIASPVYAADGIIDNIKKAYNSIHDVKGIFEQTNVIHGNTRVFTAKFSIKIPYKMRWRYDGERAQEVFINDREVIFYQPLYKQAYRTSYNESTYGLKELSLLGSFANVEQSYELSETKDYARLVPRHKESSIKYIDVYPGKGYYPIEKVVITGSDENVITITIKEAKINNGIGDSIFVFSPPEGTTFVEK